MKRNWYAVYTKAGQEKRVAALLTKKKIENFLPINKTLALNGGKSKYESEPLIASFVFVNITEVEMDVIKRFNFIINFVYWLGGPAVFRESEIDNLKHFTKEYTDIKLEKISVSVNSMVRIINLAKNSASDFEPIQSPVVKLILPSLGYILTSETGNVLETKASFNLGSNLFSQAR